jgi:hypothetical protein
MISTWAFATKKSMAVLAVLANFCSILFFLILIPLSSIFVLIGQWPQFSWKLCAQKLSIFFSEPNPLPALNIIRALDLSDKKVGLGIALAELITGGVQGKLELDCPGAALDFHSFKQGIVW